MVVYTSKLPPLHLIDYHAKVCLEQPGKSTCANHSSEIWSLAKQSILVHPWLKYFMGVSEHTASVFILVAPDEPFLAISRLGTS